MGRRPGWCDTSGRFGAPRPRLELLGRRGAKCVGGGQQDLGAAALEAVAELGHGRRLAGAVDADDEHDRGHARRRNARPGRRVAWREQGKQLSLDRGLGVLHITPFSGALDHLAGQRCAEVGRDERLFDLFPCVVIERAAQDSAQPADRRPGASSRRPAS